MAIIVKTENSSSLLQSIYLAIDNKKIHTWTYIVFEGKRYLTHSPEQWIKKAYLLPEVYDGELRFGIVPPRDQRIADETRGVYHGRFVEMLMGHFRTQFSVASATSQNFVPDIS